MNLKDFSLPRVVPCFPLLGLTPSGLFMGLSSNLIYSFTKLNLVRHDFCTAFETGLSLTGGGYLQDLRPQWVKIVPEYHTVTVDTYPMCQRSSYGRL